MSTNNPSLKMLDRLKVSDEQAKNFIKLMTAIHSSFDRIIALRNSSATYKGNTLASFETQIHLENILKELPKNEEGTLTTGTVRNFLIKNFASDNVSGILGWIIKENQPLKAIEIVNPNQDLLDKYMKYGANLSTSSYKDFLRAQNAKKQIQSLGKAVQQEFKDLKFGNTILTNLRKFLKEKEENPDTQQANWWMLAPSNTPFNLETHHIVFQEIAEINRQLWETTDKRDTQYELFMRGKEIIVKSSLTTKEKEPPDNKNIKNYCLSSDIVFPVSVEGLQNLSILFGLLNIGQGINNYFEYNDNGEQAIAKINSFKNMFVHANDVSRKLYQMTVREEYKHLGMPIAQQYDSSTGSSSSSTTITPQKQFKTTPYSKKKGLICSLCTRVIEDAGGTASDDWAEKFDKRQSYDVDHLLNLIFNDLFGLNEMNHGLGFTNTCGDCNRQFKGEKLWSPSINLWEAIIIKAGLIEKYKGGLYPWPGRNMKGILDKMPFGGYRVFTIQNSNEGPRISGQNEDNYHKALNETQGITWKIGKKKKKKLNPTTELKDKNFKDVEEIFFDRILKMITIGNADANSLVNKVLNQNDENGHVPIVKKYVSSIKNFPLGSILITALTTWDERNFDEKQLRTIIQNIKMQKEAIKRSNMSPGNSIEKEMLDDIKGKSGEAQKLRQIIGMKINSIKRQLSRVDDVDQRKKFESLLNKYHRELDKNETYDNLLKLQKDLRSQIASGPSSGSGSGSGSGTRVSMVNNWIKTSTPTKEEVAKAKKIALKTDEQQLQDIKASVQKFNFMKMGNQPMFRAIPRPLLEQFQQLDFDIKQSHPGMFESTKTAIQAAKAFFTKIKSTDINQIESLCENVTSFSEGNLGAWIRRLNNDYNNDYNVTKRNYMIQEINFNAQYASLSEDKQQSGLAEITALKEEMNEKLKNKSFINKVWLYYATIGSLANNCAAEHRRSSIVSESLYSITQAPLPCNDITPCKKNYQICDLDIGQCVGRTPEAVAKYNKDLQIIESAKRKDIANKGKKHLRDAANTGNEKRPRENDGDNNTGPTRKRRRRGGNKTRKNRKRKNRTKRKKSSNKKNTKKHRRRKNKTRNMR
jgi:hypothetical protein